MDSFICIVQILKLLNFNTVNIIHAISNTIITLRLLDIWSLEMFLLSVKSIILYCLHDHSNGLVVIVVVVVVVVVVESVIDYNYSVHASALVAHWKFLWKYTLVPGEYAQEWLLLF